MEVLKMKPQEMYYTVTEDRPLDKSYFYEIEKDRSDQTLQILSNLIY